MDSTTCDNSLIKKFSPAKSNKDYNKFILADHRIRRLDKCFVKDQKMKIFPSEDIIQRSKTLPPVTPRLLINDYICE